MNAFIHSFMALNQVYTVLLVCGLGRCVCKIKRYYGNGIVLEYSNGNRCPRFFYLLALCVLLVCMEGLFRPFFKYYGVLTEELELI